MKLKKKLIMRFHPVVAIFIGFIVYEILRLIARISFGLVFDIILVSFIIAFAGFIATYFSKEQKIRYGLIEGNMYNNIYDY